MSHSHPTGSLVSETPPENPAHVAPPVVRTRAPRHAWWLPVIGAAFAAALVAYGWQREDSQAAAASKVAAASAVPTVRVHVVAPAASKAQLTLPATLEPAQRTELHARASGYVKQWHADLGQRVEAGAVLAELETPDLDQDVRRAEAAVTEARASLALAQTTAGRFRRLMQDSAVAQQDLDTREAELRVREAALVAAEAGLSRVQELTRFQIVRAPFDGVVTARRIEVGDLVVAGANGDGLFVLEQTDTLRAFVDLPQTYVRFVQPAQAVNFQLPEAPGRLFRGTIVRTAGTLNSATRSMRVELELPNREGELMAGAFGQIHLELSRSGDVVTVPGTSVRIQSQGAFVALVDAENKIQLRAVKLGHDLGGDIEIVHGLQAGERVVRNPTDQLRAGTKVHVLQAIAQK